MTGTAEITDFDVELAGFAGRYNDIIVGPGCSP
jgi:hypothetical protein